MIAMAQIDYVKCLQEEGDGTCSVSLVHYLYKL